MQVEELRQQVQVLQAVGYNSLEGFAGEEEGTAGAMTLGPQTHFVSIHGASAVLCLHDSKLP